MRIVKIFVLLLLFLSISVPALAADEILMDNTTTENGGYGGPQFMATSIYNTPSLMTGGYGGWLINRKFLIGMGGVSLISTVKAPDGIQNINFYYGGIVFEYIDNPGKLVHFTGGILIGAGNIDYSLTPSTRSNCFVIEPNAKLTVNINHWFRGGIGASYRMVSGVDLAGLTNNDLSGISFNLALNFGKF